MNSHLSLQKIWFGALVILFSLCPLVARAQQLGRVDFDRDIRPILSDNCFGCHGPDEAARQADLRLDVLDGLLAIKKEGTIVVPYHSDKSELVRRILSRDPEVRMPPPKFERTLSERQIELFRRWIDQGAEWKTHWSFRRPVRPLLPLAPEGDSNANPIDLLVQDRLRQMHGESPEWSSSLGPQADLDTLIRRLTLDLTGLPPTLSERVAFRNDRSENAVEKLVNRLLASPHFGERLAVDWLDGARYADTSGYQNDGPRHMWRWRDWVIDAFNRDQPFDQFTIEQIAGDLLPDATVEQRIATGFQRNHRGNAEGGIVPAEFAVEYVVDRVETTSAVWLGLTLGCARCHDHKYDPVSQKEFYQLFAFFNNVPESGRAIKEGNSPPYIMAPTSEQQAALTLVDEQIRSAEVAWERMQTKIVSGQAEWEATYTVDKAPDSDELSNHEMVLGFGQLIKFDGRHAEPQSQFDSYYTGAEPVVVQGAIGEAIEFDGQHFVELGDVGKFGYFDKFTISAWIQPHKADGNIVSRMSDVSQGDGYSLVLHRGHLQLNLVKRWLDDALRVETDKPIPLDRWTHVVASYDGSRVAAGVRFYINGQLQTNHVNLDQINQTFVSNEPLRVGAGNGPESRFTGSIDEVSLYDRLLQENEILALSCSDPIAKIALIPPDQRSPRQSRKIDIYYLERLAPPEFRQRYYDLLRLRQQRQRMLELMPTVMIMQEMSRPRATHILSRGQYDQPLNEVEPGTPNCLPALPVDAPPNRLSLAHWLTSPEQPLTSRVIVNRYWQLLFGVGLVKTSEDFGIQGERPSHPELLDWLACEFVDSGWDLKKLIKTIVLSRTYQQSSAGSPDSWRLDPENRLLSRGPRFRLSAETIRDQSLAASGLLTRSIGGPSSKPYQPEGLWGEIATDMEYVPSSGADLYRRSLYTYWKRTVAPPGMQTLDAPSRETCVVRRAITNTPLQALLLMNEEGIVETAQQLAQRSIREAGHDPQAFLSHAFELTLGRSPAHGELEILLQSWHGFRARYQFDPIAAKSALSIGSQKPDPTFDDVELATMTAVSSLILNLDEAISKE